MKKVESWTAPLENIRVGSELKAIVSRDAEPRSLLYRIPSNASDGFKAIVHRLSSKVVSTTVVFRRRNGNVK
jgi:hypothetical protein